MKKTLRIPNYKVLDTKDSEKLELIHGVSLRRPDNNAKGPIGNGNLWSRIDASYQRKNNQEGEWIIQKEFPEDWSFSYRSLKFKLQLLSNKHIGVFFEQIENWKWLEESIRTANRPIRVLNLFGYTGAASLIAAYAGAVEVVHVEASKSTLNLFKENRTLNEMDDFPIRPIQEDAFKFVEREIKRNHHYDMIILDPPSFGKGPNGEVWKLETDLESLLKRINVLLSDDAFGLLISTYSEKMFPRKLEALVKQSLDQRSKKVEVFEWHIPIESKEEQTLNAGLSARVLFK